jgi:succinate dehydrogenase/fumarate reductase flavoprotein subunit
MCKGYKHFFGINYQHGQITVAAWKTYGNISRTCFEGIERFIQHKNLKLNPDTEYYDREVKRLKVKVRRAHNRRKLGEHYKAEMKRLSKKLLSAKRNAQETFLSSLLQNEGKS